MPVTPATAIPSLLDQRTGASSRTGQCATQGALPPEQPSGKTGPLWVGNSATDIAFPKPAQPVARLDSGHPATSSDRRPLDRFVSTQSPLRAAPTPITEGGDYREIAASGGHLPGSTQYKGLREQALRAAMSAAMDDMTCMDAAQKFHVADIEKDVQTLMVNVATLKGHPLLASGVPLSDVQSQLGISSNTLAGRILAHGCKVPAGPAAARPASASVPVRAAPPPSTPSPVPPPPASLPGRTEPRVAPCPPELLPVHIAPREPHPYRMAGAEEGLTRMCEKVARGADYDQLAVKCGYYAPNQDFEGECSEYNALKHQAMYSTRKAIEDGMTVPKALERFHIKSKDDQEAIAMFAAEHLGVPRVSAGERFNAVKNDLDIAAYGEAVQLLVEADTR